MQISSRKLNQHIESQIFQLFHQVLCDTKDLDEMDTILKSLLSEAEHLVVAKRLAIAVYLEKGRSYENIKQSLKVSSATIASVQDMMSDEGLILALRKVKAEEWADKWATRLRRLVK